METLIIIFCLHMLLALTPGSGNSCCPVSVYSYVCVYVFVCGWELSHEGPSYKEIHKGYADVLWN